MFKIYPSIVPLMPPLPKSLVIDITFIHNVSSSASLKQDTSCLGSLIPSKLLIRQKLASKPTGTDHSL